MFATQRQERILEQIRLTGNVRVADLVEQLGVSDMTVRRDISVLAAEGLLRRVHGGATAAGRGVANALPLAAGAAQRTAQKSAIATTAAALVKPGSSIALSGGTTTREVALALKPISGLTVVTNSLPVADVLQDQRRDDLTVILTGGVRSASNALVGPVTMAALQDLHVDWAFLGAHGLDEQAGLTVPSLMEAETNRALMAAGRRVAFVVDSGKWQTVGLRTVARLEEVDVLITDSGLSHSARKILQPLVGRLLVADV